MRLSWTRIWVKVQPGPLFCSRPSDPGLGKQNMYLNLGIKRPSNIMELAGILLCSFFTHHAVIPIVRTRSMGERSPTASPADVSPVDDLSSPLLDSVDVEEVEDTHPLISKRYNQSVKQHPELRAAPSLSAVSDDTDIEAGAKKWKRISVPFFIKRALMLSYLLGACMYVIPGYLGQYSMQYHNGYQEDQTKVMNFLNAFESTHKFPMSARFAVGMQLFTCIPLILYIMRTQVFGLLFDTDYPNMYVVVAFNTVVLTVTSLCSVNNVGLGNIMRYTGASVGLLLMFLLPITIHLLVLNREGSLTNRSLAAHSVLFAAGFFIFITQFFPLDELR
ncbi:hypothetical protein CYMTET_33203 [Cymbomonas tetramitiformis]|uniref:Uncharacterized protein n=1 Tax=Cymbomonas tetramitiformis TaxID=36881 RepID=A0AAE0FDI4_9CHLO|nr:hypothetical protein CYMTET_33203 [Cymbomonas tetramitiformis]